MGGGHGTGAEMELSLVAALQASSMPASLLQALRTLDQELGEETEREALDGVVDSLVEWFLHESRAPRTADGRSFVRCIAITSLLSLYPRCRQTWWRRRNLIVYGKQTAVRRIKIYLAGRAS